MRVHPGTTARGVADAAAAPFPAHAEALRSAAADFDAVRYLGRSGSREDYDALTRLEGELAGTTPATTDRESTDRRGPRMTATRAPAGAPGIEARHRLRRRGDHADPARDVPAQARVDRHRGRAGARRTRRAHRAGRRTRARTDPRRRQPGAARVEGARPGAPRTRRRRARGANGRGRDRRGDGRRDGVPLRRGRDPRDRPPRRARPRPPTASSSPSRGSARSRRWRPACASRARRAARSTTSPARPGLRSVRRRCPAASGCSRSTTRPRRPGGRAASATASSATPSSPGPVPSGGEVALVAATTVFENEHVDESGNAALAIGLLGASDELVWYLPGPGDADAAEAPTLAELTPGWVSPVMVLAIAVTIAAGVWRGRRFGPLVVERLPVQVPAGETSEGRARLYARSAARGARARPAPHRRDRPHRRRAAAAPLGAGRGGRGCRGARDRARRGIRGTAARRRRPAGDRELVDLAAELDRLEHDVAASVRPRPDDRTDPTGRRP